MCVSLCVYIYLYLYSLDIREIKFSKDLSYIWMVIQLKIPGQRLCIEDRLNKMSLISTVT